MSALDKSLDEIISSARRTRRVGGAKASANRVGKKFGGSNKKPLVNIKKTHNAGAAKRVLAQAQKAATGLDLTAATKVVVHNLPRDLKQEHIKEFFQSQVGGVSTIVLNYNEKGNFKGDATIDFKTHKSAALAVQKYNGAPIDGGSSKLRLELVIDPSKKSLASRIVANPVAAQKAIKKAETKAKAKGEPAKKGDKPKPKPKKPVAKKKTLEELDQEMTDYFS